MRKKYKNGLESSDAWKSELSSQQEQPTLEEFDSGATSNLRVNGTYVTNLSKCPSESLRSSFTWLGNLHILPPSRFLGYIGSIYIPSKSWNKKPDTLACTQLQRYPQKVSCPRQKVLRAALFLQAMTEIRHVRKTRGNTFLTVETWTTDLLSPCPVLDSR